jgi:hypothetical protein
MNEGAKVCLMLMFRKQAIVFKAMASDRWRAILANPYMILEVIVSSNAFSRSRIQDQHQGSD